MSKSKTGNAASQPAPQPGSNNNAWPSYAAAPDSKGWFNLPFILLSLAFILFGVLNFNAKLFMMGDDANYILDGYNFIHRHTYPEQSSLYGMVMGLIELVTGTNVVLLKCCSFLFAFIGFVTLYRIGYKRIEPRVLYPVLVFSAISSSMQYYSSSNLSEAFYMMLQYFYTGYIFLFIDKLAKGEQDMKKYWLGLGLMGLLMSLGKNIAIVAPLAIVFYFLFYKQWRNALKAFGVFLLFKIPYELLLRVIYKKNTAVGQLDQVLAKNLYHHEEGRETLAGFGARFVKNIQIYFSQGTMHELGFSSEGGTALLVTLLVTALLIAALVFAYKKNKYIFFIGLYTGVMAGVTFVALQPEVWQTRIIIILIPYLFMLMLYALVCLFERAGKQYGTVTKIVYAAILAIVAWTNLSRASTTISENLPALRENLAGDTYYGFTPDWLNYLEMGKWVNEHLPANVVVAARKPNPLSVYSNGRDFYGIYSFPTNLNADELLDKLKKDNVSYLILASLRADPNVADPANIVATIHRYAMKIAEKYPNAIKITHTVGRDEPSYLVQIIYPEKK